MMRLLALSELRLPLEGQLHGADRDILLGSLFGTIIGTIIGLC